VHLPRARVHLPSATATPVSTPTRAERVRADRLDPVPHRRRNTWIYQTTANVNGARALQTNKVLSSSRYPGATGSRCPRLPTWPGPPHQASRHTSSTRRDHRIPGGRPRGCRCSAPACCGQARPTWRRAGRSARSCASRSATPAGQQRERHRQGQGTHTVTVRPHLPGHPGHDDHVHQGGRLRLGRGDTDLDSAGDRPGQVRSPAAHRRPATLTTTEELVSFTQG